MNLTRIRVGWPEEKEALPFGALAEIFASAVTPTTEASDPEDLAFHLTVIDYESRLSKAVQEGELIIRNPVTWDALPCWANSDEAIVRVSDVKTYLERTGSVIELVPLKNEQQLPAPATWQGHTYQPGPEMKPEEADHAAAWVDAVNEAEDLGQVERQDWTVIKYERDTAYRPALRRYLVNEWQKGTAHRPTAKQVLDAFALSQPPEIAKVLVDGFDYYDSNGNTKFASLDAIRKTIGRMTTGR